jgi:hypothetical protein
MFNWFIRRKIREFETTYDYDATYSYDMLDHNRDAFFALYRAGGLGQVQHGVPRDAFYAAKLVGALHEDCGPCVQLVANMATRAGVGADVVKAVLRRDWALLPEPVALAARFAHAVLERSPEQDSLRDLVEARFGRTGLVSLAVAIAGARIYPGVKYAMGYGKHCQKVVVDGQAVAAARPVLAEPALS